MKVHVNENKRYILETYWVASEIPNSQEKDSSESAEMFTALYRDTNYLTCIRTIDILT